VKDGRRGAYGEVWVQDDETGARVGSYPEYGTAFVEGRLGALLRGVEDHALTPPSAVLDGAAVAAGLLQRHGFHVGPNEAGVRRADLAADLDFDDGRDGLALLHGFAALDVPWAKTGTEGGKGLQLETVYHRHVRSRRVQARLYDKATEAQLGERATRVRFERQGHYKAERMQRVDRYAAMDHRRLMVGTVDRYLSTGVVHVVTPTGAAHVVRAALEAGTLTPLKASRTIGDLHLYEWYGPAAWSRSGYYLRAGEWRKLGLAVTHRDELRELADVIPLSSYFERVRERWAA
jgi:hypothetical protein